MVNSLLYFLAFIAAGALVSVIAVAGASKLAPLTRKRGEKSSEDLACCRFFGHQVKLA